MKRSKKITKMLHGIKMMLEKMLHKEELRKQYKINKMTELIHIFHNKFEY